MKLKNSLVNTINDLHPLQVTTTNSRSWPFVGEETFRQALLRDRELAMASFMLQYTLQEEVEVGARETLLKNKRGFMSSHAKTATRVAEAIVSGEAIPLPDGGFRADGQRFQTMEDYAAHVGSRYAKSTLRACIEVMCAQDPELAKRVAVFMSQA